MVTYKKVEPEHYYSDLKKPSVLPVIRIQDFNYFSIFPKRNEDYDIKEAKEKYDKLNESLSKRNISINVPFLILPDRDKSDLVKIVLKTDPMSAIKYNATNLFEEGKFTEFIHNLMENKEKLFYNLETPLQAIIILSELDNHYSNILKELEDKYNHKIEEIIIKKFY